MTVVVHHGDCRAVLAAREGPLFDSCVTDPPYHLTSIVKRFGKPDAAPCKVGATGAFERSARGFMGQTWDGGDVAFQPETWRIIFDQLKPGAHLVAFGGSRNFHRLVCAIEDAGFEIRDTLYWLYASGFPKSHNISKAIDKRPGVLSHADFAADLRAAMAAKGYTNTFDVAEAVIGRRTGAVANWQKYQFPQAKWWPALRDLLDMGGKWDATIAEAERAKTGERAGNLLAVAPGQNNDRSATVLDITAPATDAAREWEGWGTALKPAFEPIVLARKPVEGSVAQNVLKYGTGALNIDACRVGVEDEEYARNCSGDRGHADNRSREMGFGMGCGQASDEGRWPANILTDGSPEVEALFPEQSGGGTPTHRDSDKFRNVYGDFKGGAAEAGIAGSSGNAARFYFSAKAGDLDRLGSQHATVKPVALKRWLERLITPPGGLILDPFAGSGTTGIAAIAEGFNAELIELEAKHVEDINRRLAIIQGEGRHTLVEINAGKKRQGKPMPLFGEEDAA